MTRMLGFAGRGVRIPGISGYQPFPVLSPEKRNQFSRVHDRTRLVDDLVGLPLPREIARRKNITHRLVLDRESRRAELRDFLYEVLAYRSAAMHGALTRCAQHGILGVERTDR